MYNKSVDPEGSRISQKLCVTQVSVVSEMLLHSSHAKKHSDSRNNTKKLNKNSKILITFAFLQNVKMLQISPYITV